MKIVRQVESGLSNFKEYLFKCLQTSAEYRFEGTFQDSIKKKSEKNLQNVARNSHPRESYQQSMLLLGKISCFG